MELIASVISALLLLSVQHISIDSHSQRRCLLFSGTWRATFLIKSQYPLIFRRPRPSCAFAAPCRAVTASLKPTSSSPQRCDAMAYGGGSSLNSRKLSVLMFRSRIIFRLVAWVAFPHPHTLRQSTICHRLRVWHRLESVRTEETEDLIFVSQLLRRSLCGPL
jgi:hypothetical protein